MNIYISNKNKLLALFSILISLIILNIFDINSFASAMSGDLTVPLKNFYEEYHGFVNVFTAFVIITNLLIFIYHFCRLGAVSSNPKARAECLGDMLTSGVCLGLIGGGSAVMYILFFLAN